MQIKNVKENSTFNYRLKKQQQQKMFYSDVMG